MLPPLPDLSVLAVVLPLIFLSGVVDAVAGGGGLISLPAYMLAGLPPHLAIGTNKLSSAMGMALSCSRYLRVGYVNWHMTVPAVVFALLGGMAGAKAGLWISPSVFQTVLIFLLPVVAAAVQMKGMMRDSTREMSAGRRWGLVAVSAFGAGVYDGFYGPGAGTFMLMAFTGLAGLSVQSASGTMKCSNLASGLAALFVYALASGAVDWVLGVLAGLFAMAGNWVGSSLLMHRGARAVRPFMLTVIALLFAKLLYDNFLS